MATLKLLELEFVTKSVLIFIVVSSLFKKLLARLKDDEMIENLREIKAGDTAALEAEKKKMENERDAVGLLAQEALDEYARTGQEEEKSKGLLAEYDRLSAAVQEKERAIESVKARQRRIDEFIRSLETAGEEFTEALWGSLVEKVTVYRDGMVFLLTCGREMKV